MQNNKIAPITIVIPTAGRVKNITTKLIHSIQDYVDQIILFDNKRQFNKKDFAENVLVIRKNDLAVNPAWQKGVEMARNDTVVLMNDDILFNHNEGELFEEIIFELSNNQWSVVGADNSGMVMFDEESELPSELPYEGFYCTKAEKRNENWGAFIALKKHLMVPIHEDLKIYYGDDIIFNFSPLMHPHAKCCGKMWFKWYHRMSSTSSQINDDVRDFEIQLYSVIIEGLNRRLEARRQQEKELLGTR